MGAGLTAAFPLHCVPPVHPRVLGATCYALKTCTEIEYRNVYCHFNFMLSGSAFGLSLAWSGNTGTALGVISSDKQGSAQGIQCPKCNASNPQNAKFCSSCGGPMTIAKMVCPACNEQIKADSKFCPSCGANLQQVNCKNCSTPLKPGAKFCPECGTEQ